MSENVKTLAFVAVAAVAVLLAVVTQPRLHVSSPENVLDQPLFPELKDPLAVAHLEITKFDEKTASLQPFAVSRIDIKGTTRWVIPSHDNYPADATDQVASAAASLLGLKPLKLQSDNQGDHREYGVVDPDPKTLKLGSTGVGMKVVMKDAAGKDLLDLIIGKPVPDQPGLRYVRKTGQSAIYVAEIKTDKLTTDFENWIERNLLQINTFDMKQVQIRDYAIKNYGGALAIVQRGKMRLDYDDAAEKKWTLADDQEFLPDDQSAEGGRWTPIALADDEELNLAKLDEMKNALSDLKIVDVAEKPKGLSANLKVEADFANNREAVESLADKGFLIGEIVKGQPEIFSADGEFHVLMKNGVRYILRFGDIAGKSASKSDESQKDEKNDSDSDGKKAPESKTAGLNRYLFIMAEFNPEIIPVPQFEPLPEPKKDGEPKAADANKPEKNKGESTKPESEKNDQDGKTDPSGEVANKASEKPDPERERIEKENQRKQDEYDQKIADGKKKVEELNARFADWYYVISDEVYRKIHLGRGDIVKKKEVKKDEAGQKSESGRNGDNHSHGAVEKSADKAESDSGSPDTPVEQLEKLKAEGLDKADSKAKEK